LKSLHKLVPCPGPSSFWTVCMLYIQYFMYLC
jgi:hypothetical protein